MYDLIVYLENGDVKNELIEKDGLELEKITEFLDFYKDLGFQRIVLLDVKTKKRLIWR